MTVPFFPFGVMGNVRTQLNKKDNLGTFTKLQLKYQKCSTMCFTDTWHQEHIPDSNSTGVPLYWLTETAGRVVRRKKGGLQCDFTTDGIILDMLL